MIIYALHDECHGIIGYYANDYKAKEACKKNAKLYDIDPETTELDYDGAWHWGWSDSYIEKIDVEDSDNETWTMRDEDGCTIGHYKGKEQAKLECCKQASKYYGINPFVDELQYDEPDTWGWEYCYIEKD